MTADRRVGNKVPEFINKDKAQGANIRDPGPYIGVVKNNADPIRAGRMQVYIADFGGTETEQSHWITVCYASPFTGAARTPFDKTNPPISNEYTHTNHSYGMWFTPPDIGNHVLVTFVNGDVNRGYWFACIMPDLSHYATPAIAGANKVVITDPELKKVLLTPPYPVVEYNEGNPALQKEESDFLEIKKPVHEHQVRTLLNQGLEDDKVRGVISSSAQRESPSRVFGISTPGVEGFEDKEYTVNWRKGGHTFVMDDGTVPGTVGAMGKDQLIRLRSAGGHQLLMNDSEEIVYIGNANGKTWMEFTKDGKILVFAANDISVRTEKSINFHADEDINMFAGKNIKMFANTSIQEQSDIISLKASTELKEYGGLVNLKSGSSFHIIAGSDIGIGSSTELVCSSGVIHLNTKAAPAVATPANIPETVHPEPIKEGLKWVKKGKRPSTIPLTTKIPTHEPYADHITTGGGTVSTTPAPAPNIPTSEPAPVIPPPASVLTDSQGNAVLDGSGQPIRTQGEAPPPGIGPTTSTGTGVKVRASDAAVANQIAKYPGPAVGSMTSDETSALKAQLAQHESGGIDQYDKVGGAGGNYLGKYQVGAGVLETQGYVKPGTSNAGLNDPANWTGKDGMTSKESFLAAPATQEKVMDRNIVQNYNQLQKAGVVNASSDPAVVSGNLSAAHLKGAGATIQWNKGTLANTKDGFGTDISTYYNEGRYANTVLAKNYSSTTTVASASQATLVKGGNTKTV